MDYSDHPDIETGGAANGCELVSLVEYPTIFHFITILDKDGSSFTKNIPFAVYVVPSGDIRQIDYENPIAVGELVYEGYSKQFAHSMNFSLILLNGEGVDYVIFLTEDGRVVPISEGGQINGMCNVTDDEKDPATATPIIIIPKATNTPNPPPPTEEPTATPIDTPIPLPTPTHGG